MLYVNPALEMSAYANSTKVITHYLLVFNKLETYRPIKFT